MDIKNMLSIVDHTLLKPETTWAQIQEICDDGMHYGACSVCIPPSFVKRAKAYVGDRIRICTVIGFPNGYNTSEVKIFEAQNAIENGAAEIDMVINIGDLKDKNYDAILAEIRALKRVCGDKVLKVIIETALLTQEEKIKMAEIVTKSGADFIKTSTGFSTGGATFEDVKLLREYVGKSVKVKAAGGIASLADAEEFMALGADRLGTSKVIRLVKEEPIDSSEY